MNTHKTSILISSEGYLGTCICGWKTDKAQKVKSAVEFQTIAHKRTTRDFDSSKVVITDPETPLLPFGCIHAKDLVKLSQVLINLEVWHASLKGDPRDHPCLRRIESSDGRINAHVSIGPSIGGTWIKLTLTEGAWEMDQDMATILIKALDNDNL